MASAAKQYWLWGPLFRPNGGAAWVASFPADLYGCSATPTGKRRMGERA
jgi:hypothetical protein